MTFDEEYKFFKFEDTAKKSITRAKDFENFPFRDVKFAETEILIQQTEYYAVKHAYACATTNPESKFIYEDENQSLIEQVYNFANKVLSWNGVNNIICNRAIASFLLLSPNFHSKKDSRMFGVYKQGYLESQNKVVNIYVAPSIVIPENEFLYYYDGVYIKGKVIFNK